MDENISKNIDLSLINVLKWCKTVKCILVHLHKFIVINHYSLNQNTTMLHKNTYKYLNCLLTIE